MKKHHVKVMSYGPEDEELAEVWWDTDVQQIKCTNKLYVSQMRRMTVGGFKYQDGEKFMEHFPQAFKSGYISCVKVDDDVE